MLTTSESPVSSLSMSTAQNTRRAVHSSARSSSRALASDPGRPGPRGGPGVASELLRRLEEDMQLLHHRGRQLVNRVAGVRLVHGVGLRVGVLPHPARPFSAGLCLATPGHHAGERREAPAPTREQPLLAQSPYQERSRMNTRDAQGLGIRCQCSRIPTREQLLLAQSPYQEPRG